MSTFKSACLLLCAALGLPAATLTVGTAAIAPGQTGTVNISLTQGGTISGLQFDLTYDPTVFTVLNVTAGAVTTAVSKGVSVNQISSSGTTAVKRAIIIGGQTAGTLAQGQAVFTDGTVATLTVTVAANAPLGTKPLSVSGLVATTPTATAAALTGADGAVTIANTYLVGDFYPSTADTVGNFGDHTLDINDLVQILFAANSVPGFLPSACSDRKDAMDLFPVDTVSTRGGDGVVDINDLVTELFRANNIDNARPVRASRGGVCSPQAALSTARADRPTRTIQGADGRILIGGSQTVAGQERIPIYLEARRNLDRVALTLAVGDMQTQLKFSAGDRPASLVQDNQTGVVALAWADGLTVRAGSRLLLGYVTGPSGVSSRLQLFGMSAAGLDDKRLLDVDSSSLAGQKQ